MACAKTRVGVDPFAHSLPLTAETGIEPPTLWLTALPLYWMSVILYAAAWVSNNIKAFYHFFFPHCPSSRYQLWKPACSYSNSWGEKANMVSRMTRTHSEPCIWHTLFTPFLNFFTVIALYTVIICKQGFHLRGTNKTEWRWKNESVNVQEDGRHGKECLIAAWIME